MLVRLEDFDLVAAERATNEPLRETRSVYWVKLIDMRNIVELNVPGSLGNVLQDMGREPVSILIAGEFVGPEAKASLESLMSKYVSDSNKPMQFTSDLTVAAPKIAKVMLDQFHFEEIAGNVNRYRYYMKLVEYREPRPPQEEKAPEQETEEVLKEGEIDDIRGQVLDAKGNPVAGARVRVKGPAKESEVTTDEQGFYEMRDVPEGEYEITAQEEGYEEEKQTIGVKKGKSNENKGES